MKLVLGTVITAQLTIDRFDQPGYAVYMNLEALLACEGSKQ